VLYFGESLLLPEYRGRGIGHRFFDLREQHAGKLGLPLTAFCAVDRPPDHPKRPDDYRPLDGFWTSRGYVKRAGLRAVFDWKEIGASVESPHSLTFWLRGAQKKPGKPGRSSNARDELDRDKVSPPLRLTRTSTPNSAAPPA